MLLVFSNHPDLQAKAEAGIASAEKIIVAAASKQPIKNSHNVLYISKELIEDVLSGFEGSFHRFHQLINPVWHDEPVETFYPKAHLRFVWSNPLKIQSQNVITHDGTLANLTLLTNRVSENKYIQISFVSLEKNWILPSRAVVNTAFSSLTGMGIKNTKPLAFMWRNRFSAEATGSTNTAEREMHFAVRVIEAPKHTGFWQIITVTSTSIAEALTLKETVENSLQLQ